MRGQEPRILDRIPFNGRERFRAVGHARSVAEIDKAFIRQMLMQRAIDSQSANAAVEDADGKRGYCRLPIAQLSIGCGHA